MRIVVTGPTGLVGTALIRSLGQLGHDMVRCSRGPAWDPEAGRIDPALLEGADAVVHLAGEPIAEGRWDAAKKVRIRDSRAGGTRLLAGTLARLARKPKVLVSASAVGWYGDRASEVLTEESPPGHGFLAEVCRLWEGATLPAAEAGIRVVNTRFGVVLSPTGGALRKMRTPFRLGLGGPLGSGEQWLSWVALDDVVAAIRKVLEDERLRGPVNVTSPNPVTNREFTKALGRALHRPTLFAMPAFAARAAFGEVADALLLASQRAVPQRLTAAGFSFSRPTIDQGVSSTPPVASPSSA